jgi:hypothetical protein
MRYLPRTDTSPESPDGRAVELQIAKRARSTACVNSGGIAQGGDQEHYEFPKQSGCASSGGGLRGGKSKETACGMGALRCSRGS